LFLGAGQAATGAAGLIVKAMCEAGLSEQDALGHCWLVDSKGLVVSSRNDLTEHKLPYAHEHEPVTGLASAVESLQPTAIIGVSAQPKVFTREVLELMARFNRRPIVFAASNPTSRSECTAEEAYEWTHGQAIFASGSPFPPVSVDGRTYVPGQGNNAHIFPGIGLGAIACDADHITDEMFLAAARILASQVADTDLATGSIYPPFRRAREISAAVAEAVAEVAYKQGLARRARPIDLAAYIRSQMWEPLYSPYV